MTPSEYAPLVVKGGDKLPAGSENGGLSYVMAMPGYLHDRTDPHVKAIYGVPELHDCHYYKTKQFTVLHVRELEGEGYAQKSCTTLAGSWKFTILAGDGNSRLDTESVLVEGERACAIGLLGALDGILLLPHIYHTGTATLG